MARPSLFTHRKLRKLARLLGSKPLAVGCLELIWNVGYADGDPRLGSVADVEMAAEWTGNPGELTRCLLEAGFIDAVDADGKLMAKPVCHVLPSVLPLANDMANVNFAIHELYDHAPEYVRKRMDREDERKRNGVTLRDLRSIAGRKGAEARWQTYDKCMANMANGSTPAPAPAPAPAPKEQEQLLSSIPRPRAEIAAQLKRSIELEWRTVFDLFWPKYPRKDCKAAALKAWMKLQPKTLASIRPKAQAIAEILAARKKNEWSGRPPDKIPHGSTFLHAEEFEVTP